MKFISAGGLVSMMTVMPGNLPHNVADRIRWAGRLTMHLLSKWVRLCVVVFGLIVVVGCGERPPIAYYLILPAAGQAKVLESEEDRLRVVLDQVAVAYKMPKTKPSDAGIIRYYQPTESLTIAFYAERSSGNIAVHLIPLSRGFESREYYQLFHKSLVAALSQAFPGRVAAMKEP